MDPRAQVLDGTRGAGSPLPTVLELSERYGIAVGTANRAVGLLKEWGLVEVRRGARAIVLPRDEGDPAEPVTTHDKDGPAPQTDLLEVPELHPPTHVVAPATPQLPDGLLELVLRRRGADISRVVTSPVPLNAESLRKLLLDGIARSGGSDEEIGQYELELRQFGASDTLLTFVTSA